MGSKIILFVATLWLLCVVNASIVTINVYDEEPQIHQETDPEINVLVRSCNNQECDQTCRRLQSPGGICVHGHCKCDNFLDNEDINDIDVRSTCYTYLCNKRCILIGFSLGTCEQKICRCS